MTTLLLVFSLLYFFPLHCKYNTIYTLFPSLYFSILNYLFIHAQISQIVSPCTHLLQTPLLFSPLLLDPLRNLRNLRNLFYYLSGIQSNSTANPNPNPNYSPKLLPLSVLPQILTRTRTTPTNTSTPIRPVRTLQSTPRISSIRPGSQNCI